MTLDAYAQARLSRVRRRMAAPARLPGQAGEAAAARRRQREGHRRRRGQHRARSCSPTARAARASCPARSRCAACSRPPRGSRPRAPRCDPGARFPGSAAPVSMTPTLILHVGNSRMKWGLRGPRGWLAQGVLPNAEIGTLCAARLAEPAASRCARSASTPPAKRRACASKARSRAGASPVEWLVAQDVGAEVVNRYRPAAQLGADRWALLVAARQRAVAQRALPAALRRRQCRHRRDGGRARRGGRVPRRPHPAGTAPHAAGDRRAHGRAQDPARPRPRLPDEHADALAHRRLQAVCGAIEQMRMPAAGARTSS